MPDDEIHDQVPAERPIDPADDPLLRLERNERSGRQAYRYAAGVIIATILTAIGVGVAGAVAGGPNCDAGASRFICSRTWELAWPLATSAVSLIGALGGFWMTYRKWAAFQRWRPWLAMCWLLLPHTLLWMTGTLSIAMFGLPD